jgi:hypothetical protein
MPLQNRVTPFGQIIATPERGAWFGNRGCLHDATGRLRRDYATTRWIFCELQFGGRRRALLQPNHYTELFFLDEVTALAAGHRPCAECMRERFNRFRAAWAAANPHLTSTPKPAVAEWDKALHADRLRMKHERRLHRARVADLPNGAMLALDDTAVLMWDGVPWAWSPSGYERWPRNPPRYAEVLTPESIVRTLAGGYVPQVHPSVASQL